ncbi:helix-turn-helix transcriptional regulator [Clostridium sp.]|uniref:helix-turn-helix transcriptional regulator n=1 Tax=Clostridium sp. TaxID=1506 RepID=UPI003D6D2BC9
MNNVLGEKIKKYRIKNKIGVNELGRKINISGAYISSLENGKKKNPSINVLLRICDALKISMFDILEGDSFSEDVNIELYKRLRETTSAKELLELAFLQNYSFSHKLEICTSSREEETEFFNMFGEYIDSYLKSQELLTMPWIEPNSDD